MTTKESTQPTESPSGISFMRNRFKRQAYRKDSETFDDEDDKDLKALARCILSEAIGSNKNLDDHEFHKLGDGDKVACAEEAAKLLKKISEKIEAPKTLRLLWDTLLRGWMTTKDQKVEAGLGKAFLATPRFPYGGTSTSKREDQFKDAFQKSLWNLYDPNRLLRLLDLVDDKSNETAIRLAVKGLGSKTGIPQLLFAMKAMAYFGADASHSGFSTTATGRLGDVGPTCLKQIADIIAVHKAASEMTGYLSKALPTLKLKFERPMYYPELENLSDTQFEVQGPGSLMLLKRVPVPKDNYTVTEEQVKAWLPIASESLGKWYIEYRGKHPNMPHLVMQIKCELIAFEHEWERKKDLPVLGTLIVTL